METLEDAVNSLSDLPVHWVCGGHPLELLDGIDLLCLSGGVSPAIPLAVEASARMIPVSNDSQIFLEETPCTVVGITGSAGKTTTTALLGQIASQKYWSRGQSEVNRPELGAAVWVGGNIGNPLIADVADIRSEDLAVMELSSFQLELMNRSPQVAVLLNITPNHLDRHRTMEAYTAAKRRILEFQGESDTAVLGRDDPGAWSLRDEVRGKLAVFGSGDPGGGYHGSYVEDGEIHLRDGTGDQTLMETASVPLRGHHNMLNVLAAAATARAVGIAPALIRSGIESFSGLPHRLEFVRTWGGADWINDSIATAPERTIAALRAYDPPIVLLAGGRDKDLPWESLAREIHRRVDHLILFGEAASIILEAFGGPKQGHRRLTISRCAGLHDAVLEASRLVQPGDTVLLSPGGTSFDEFGDFEERGDRFKKWVNQLS
jgi:UDP-N-acetylmuramoylalanine--D-glutamate ligase